MQSMGSGKAKAVRVSADIEAAYHFSVFWELVPLSGFSNSDEKSSMSIQVMRGKEIEK